MPLKKSQKERDPFMTRFFFHDDDCESDGLFSRSCRAARSTSYLYGILLRMFTRGGGVFELTFCGVCTRHSLRSLPFDAEHFNLEEEARPCGDAPRLQQRKNNKSRIVFIYFSFRAHGVRVILHATHTVEKTLGCFGPPPSERARCRSRGGAG